MINPKEPGEAQVIELKELRISNLLEYKGELVQVTLLSCDIDDEYEDQICFVELGKSSNEKGGWNRSLANDLRRIPLTPEWLERMAFIKNNSGDWDGPKIEHENEVEWFCIRECGNGLFRLMGSEWPMGKPFRYVHQLQNLFFFHAQEELTIKEPV